MNIKKQDVGVWVKASEELPEKVGLYFSKDCGRYKVYTLADLKNVSSFSDSLLWLKPIKGYVLTEDELQEFALQAKMSNLLPKQFIQSITK